MPAIVTITPEFAVTAALEAGDFAALRAAGFRTVINNRPDGEDARALASAAEAAEAARHGLGYWHVPARPHELFTDPVVTAMSEAIAQAAGPVVAHCKSGQRSAIVWAAALARSEPVAAVLATLAAAGLDLAFLRDDLDRQASRSLWNGHAVPPPGATARASTGPDLAENGRRPERVAQF